VSDSTCEAKKAIRAALGDRLRGFDEEQIHRKSVEACRRLVETEEFDCAGVLMLFLPLAHEVDASAIALKAWQQDKLVTVPLVRADQRRMIPLEIRSLTEAMETDRLGVRTPSVGRPIPVDLIDLVIVPGVAFDALGRRLGRGGGYYDRFMSQGDYRARSCGLAFDEQRLDEVPTGEHDVAVDMLVTDERVLRFGGEQNRSR